MINFRVPDMTCGHCVGTITKAVAAADPGARVQVELGEHIVRVTGAARSADELQAAIESAGYTVASAEAATPKARVAGCGCGCGPRTAG